MGAGRGFSEQGLQLGEGLLDWAQIRAVGQVEEAGAGGLILACFEPKSDPCTKVWSASYDWMPTRECLVDIHR